MRATLLVIVLVICSGCGGSKRLDELQARIERLEADSRRHAVEFKALGGFVSRILDQQIEDAETKRDQALERIRKLEQ